MSVESTRETMLRYFSATHGDVRMMAEDVIFTVMATGEEYKGREGVLGMLSYFCHVPLTPPLKAGQSSSERVTP